MTIDQLIDLKAVELDIFNLVYLSPGYFNILYSL